MDPMTSLPLRITPLAPLNKVTKDPSASLFRKREREREADKEKEETEEEEKSDDNTQFDKTDKGLN